MRDLCAVCRETGAEVSCLLCAAPHHRDCWIYSAGCSIYGCSSVHNSEQLCEFQETYRLGLSFLPPESIPYAEETVPSPLIEGVQIVCCMIVFLAAVVAGLVCVADHVDQFNRTSRREPAEIMDVIHPSTTDQATCGFIRRNSAAGLPVLAGAGFIRFLTEDGVRVFPVPDGTQFDALVASQGVHPVSDFRESRD